jgi:2-polyprenyl-3-methyl-5-hydroxy-6-metoxy-1,4-benzoquinol methylase
VTISRAKPARESSFDEDYYRRFYASRQTRVQGPREVAELCARALLQVKWAGGEITSALDVGAGPGLWRDWFARRHPTIKYRSTDVSAYACARYGHEQRDITTWRAREKFDLVICQGVLPYLPRKGVVAAIENLAAMTRGFLYLEAVTARDLDELCDHEKTDGAMKRHPGALYRKHLQKHFMSLGFGLWIKRGAADRLYELERGP